jgi:hypothetical protein
MSGGVASNNTSSGDKQVARLTSKRDHVKREHEALEAELAAKQTKRDDDIRERQQAYDDAMRALKNAQANLDAAQNRLIQGRRMQDAEDRLARTLVSGSRKDLKKAEDELFAALEPEPESQECSVCLETIPGRELKQIYGCEHCFDEACLFSLKRPICPLCRGPLRGWRPLWKKMRHSDV